MSCPGAQWRQGYKILGYIILSLQPCGLTAQLLSEAKRNAVKEKAQDAQRKAASANNAATVNMQTAQMTNLRNQEGVFSLGQS
eukprot:1156114-Pelagomonas_calceolata.AAC.4